VSDKENSQLMTRMTMDAAPVVVRHRHRPRPQWVAGGLVVALFAVAAVVALVIREPEDPALGGADIPRTPVTTRLGVFRGTDPGAVAEYESWLGRDVDYVVDFSARDTWKDISQPQYMLKAWKGTGYRPVYSLAMLPEGDSSATIRRGAAGNYDRYFRTLARRLIEAGQQDAILRLGWEFNLEDSRWATPDSAAFIRYWRRVVAAMRAQSGAAFQFDWNPNNGATKYDAVQYYPGDDVVDYVGVDAYDVSWAFHTYPYPAGCRSSCRLERQRNAWEKTIFGGKRGLRFWSRFAAHHGKPLTLPEWGLWTRDDNHGGGDNAYYLRQMRTFIKDPKNGVGYHAYFEVDGHDGPHRLMTTFPASGRVYRSLFGG
jgi:hypothetical protein